MKTCDTTFSAGHTLSEQTARQIFDSLPEEGVIVVVVDRDGTRWTSDSEAFARLGLDDALFAEFRARVDDGVEPVVGRLGDANFAMAQLMTEHTDCGYVMVIVLGSPGKPAESDVNLLEAYMGHITLVAKLTERSRQLMKMRIGCYGDPWAQESPMN